MKRPQRANFSVLARGPQLGFYRTQVSLGPDLWIRLSQTCSLTERGFADLTDVTLADEDTNSILTDNANRAIQVVQPGCQLRN